MAENAPLPPVIRRAARGHRSAGPAPGRWTRRRWTLGGRLAAVGFLLIVPIPAALAAETGVVILEGGVEEVRPEAEPPEAAARPMPGGGLQPGARTVIPLEKFRDTQLSVADVLREVPGVAVVQTGDALSPTKVRIRGSRPDQVLILLDGVPLGAVTDHPAQGRLEGRQGVDLAALPIDGVESIEIVRGAASSLYGPDAAAGAIIIRTRRGAEEGVVAERTVGPAGFRKSRVRWVKPFGESTLTLEVAQKKSDGEYVFFLPDAGQATVVTTPEAELCAPRLGGGFRLRRCNRVIP
ncbi:MAG: TonB-dependent receptor plug domain-containing protein [SAR324 cluster bacterium]|nr:TonB-dependent receptor plug domain-containing protein [SAR324 cluster bacterium]